MILEEKFEQLVNGGLIRLAYAKHDVRLFKSHINESCGLLIKTSDISGLSKEYKGLTIRNDLKAESIVVAMSDLESDVKIFTALADYLLGRISKIENVDFQTIHDIIEQWRSFVQGKSENLSKSLQIGLFGELLFLRDLISLVGEDHAVKAWSGPERNKVDFIISPDCAVEIKSSKDPLRSEVMISSLGQLSDGFERHYLRRYGLVESLNGTSILELYRDISTKLESYSNRDELHVKVMHYGFNPLIEYDSLLCFEKASEVDYDVHDADFPKITPPISPKIISVNYIINLDSQDSLGSNFVHEQLKREFGIY